jgi:hypothetical protein
LSGKNNICKRESPLSEWTICANSIGGT